MWSEKTRESVIAKLFIDNKKISKMEFLGIKIFDYAKPKIMRNEEVSNVFQDMKLEYKSSLSPC